MQVKIAESLAKSVSCEERYFIKPVEVFVSLRLCEKRNHSDFRLSCQRISSQQISAWKISSSNFTHFDVRRSTYRFYCWSLKIPQIETYRAQTTSKQDN